MLEVKSVDVYYGQMHALWNVSTEVDKGEIVALVGANETESRLFSRQCLDFFARRAELSITMERGSTLCL